MFQPEASFRSATEQHREATSEEVKIDTHSLVGGGVIIDSRNQKKNGTFFSSIRTHDIKGRNGLEISILQI